MLNSKGREETSPSLLIQIELLKAVIKQLARDRLCGFKQKQKKRKGKEKIT
jgi:hypothetical protein